MGIYCHGCRSLYNENLKLGREIRCMRQAMQQYGILFDFVDKLTRKLIKEEIKEEKSILKGRK